MRVVLPLGQQGHVPLVNKLSYRFPFMAPKPSWRTPFAKIAFRYAIDRIGGHRNVAWQKSFGGQKPYAST
jgi:hypothetical protein